MERIRSIRKGLNERRIEKAIAPIFQHKKMKINFEERSDKVFEKIVRYYMNILYKKNEETDEELFKRLGEELNLLGIKLNYKKLGKTPINPRSDAMYSRVTSAILMYNYTKKTRPRESDWSIYDITIADESLNEYRFYTTVDVKLSKKFRNISFRGTYDYNSYNIMDIYRIVAEFKIIKDMNNYITFNRRTVKEIIIDEFRYSSIPEEWNQVINDILAYCNKHDIEAPNYNISQKRYSRFEIYKLKTLYNVFDGKNIFSDMNDLYVDPLSKKNKLQYINYKYEILGKLIFREMTRDNEDLEIEAYYEDSAESEYARVFETKKNINKEVENLMEASKFKSYFDFVEYDNETDKVKIKQIEDDFIKVYDYLGLDSIKTYVGNRTIRFRKLGKHRALGLYWPGYNCVCIDLDGVSSTLHEILHMLDYTTLKRGYLRDLDGFRAMSIRYVNEMDKQVSSMNDNDLFKTSYFSSNKYNRNYYRNRAEVFARCGEIYLRKVLKLDSNLLNLCDGPQYPCSDELLNMIDRFYGKYLFTKIRHIDNKVSSSSNANTSIENCYDLKVDDNGQLMIII